jgi:hypothetical protein
MTPTVRLPMLSLANSAEMSESATSIPLTARAGDVWETALATRNVQQQRHITNILASAARATLPPDVTLVIDVLTMSEGSGGEETASPELPTRR